MSDKLQVSVGEVRFTKAFWGVGWLVHEVVTLVVNSAARSAGKMRAALPGIERVLGERGFGVRVLRTEDSPGSAERLARESLDSAWVVACGGDGTVNGVVQGLAGTGVAMGVVPLGTANALARNLGIPLDPLAAAMRLLTYRAETIPLGEIRSSSGTRYFVVMAGCGPDGALAETLSGVRKNRFGRGAYYGQAAWLFLTRRWPAFRVEYRLVGSAEWMTADAAALMASRVPDLGGLFTSLTPRAGLRDEHLHVQLLGAPGHLSLPAWFAFSRLRLTNPWLTTVDVEELRCSALGGGVVRVQADGEALGMLPISLRVAGGMLRLLMPV